MTGLARQTRPRSEYEIVVVDDASSPPVALPDVPSDCRVRIVRSEPHGRSAARNRGADEAQARIVVFVDDDVSVGPEFLVSHLRAHEEWTTALAVGAVRLPASATLTPFGHFRQRLEGLGCPTARAVVDAPNFCTAGNASIERGRFIELGGFDPLLDSGEDQDLALRHTSRGGRIVFIPEAQVVHRDQHLDFRSYCERVERGAEGLVDFARRYPEWPDNIARERVNGPVRWFDDSFGVVCRKTAKAAVASPLVLKNLHALVDVLEQRRPDSALLDRMFRLVMGGHIFRGYRKGLRR